MFCSKCGLKCGEEFNFCSKCGTVIKKKSDLSCTKPSTSGVSSVSQEVKSFNAYKMYKGKEWKSFVKGKSTKTTSDQEKDVQIMIGLMERTDRGILKPKRGRRLALNISDKAPYSTILKKAVGKWKSFNQDCYDDDEDYVLLLENGNEAQFLPGSSKEFFSLKRYKAELGKDYNKIVLYLCTTSDFICYCSDDDGDDDVPSSKKVKLQGDYLDFSTGIEENDEENVQHMKQVEDNEEKTKGKAKENDDKEDKDQTSDTEFIL